MRSRRLLLAFLFLATTTPGAGQVPSLDATERRIAEAVSGRTEEAVIYLVRHAEKVVPYPRAPADPPLTEAGRARARELARALADAGVTRILSTDYRRTRDTAAPLAQALGLEVELFDPESLEELARRLSAGGDRVLVVGHSNTTPRLVDLLGGEPGPPIDEAGEHDRLYVVALPAGGGEPATARMRYGRGAPGGDRGDRR